MGNLTSSGFCLLSLPPFSLVKGEILKKRKEKETSSLVLQQNFPFRCHCAPLTSRNMTFLDKEHSKYKKKRKTTNTFTNKTPPLAPELCSACSTDELQPPDCASVSPALNMIISPSRAELCEEPRSPWGKHRGSAREYLSRD